MAPKKAKMTDPPEPETVEEVMEEEEVDDGDGEEAGSVAIQMEVVSRAEGDIPEMDVATEESDLGDHQQQPRRSLEMIREEQEDEVKVQYANIIPHQRR